MILSFAAVAMLAFSPVSILAGSKGSPIVFFCMFLGGIIAAADAAAVFVMTQYEKEKAEKEKEN